eukprot:366577-Chlamydomonas_euryale.AAC.2
MCWSLEAVLCVLGLLDLSVCAVATPDLQGLKSSCVSTHERSEHTLKRVLIQHFLHLFAAFYGLGTHAGVSCDMAGQPAMHVGPSGETGRQVRGAGRGEGSAGERGRQERGAGR